MNQALQITLRSGKDDAVRRFHPWVFSGAIKKIQGAAADGMHAEVFDNKGHYLGSGIFQDATIAVRLYAFAPERPVTFNAAFWYARLAQALELRKLSGLVSNEQTNVYRLVHGEGDHLPGLIVDHYDGHLVVQVHATGLYHYLDDILNALRQLYGSALRGIHDKSADTLPPGYKETIKPEKSRDNKDGKIEVKENGNRFIVDIFEGQKTGFFIDQRENRRLLGQYSAGKKVLNAFCYSGGFSVYALKAGAGMVHSLDSSAKAMDLTAQNVALNFGTSANHESITADAMQYLRQMPEDYDIVILDPPAYAKHAHVKHNAVQGYKRLNLEALKKIRSGGMLFTFSCSQVVDMNLFRSTILAASILASRKVRILHQLGQPADHPVNIFHPEGQYLKGLVLLVQ
jgi:23S rRNA (cytosine1962-C5)-methyltransferase